MIDIDVVIIAVIMLAGYHAIIDRRMEPIQAVQMLLAHAMFLFVVNVFAASINVLHAICVCCIFHMVIVVQSCGRHHTTILDAFRLNFTDDRHIGGSIHIIDLRLAIVIVGLFIG